MSKMSELSLTLDELAETGRRLTECGEQLTKTALSIRECFTGSEPAQENPTQKKAPEPVKEMPKEKTYTKEEVREILSKKSVAGFREQAKALVKKYGGGSLTDIDPARYPDLVKEAEALGSE